MNNEINTANHSSQSQEGLTPLPIDSSKKRGRPKGTVPKLKTDRLIKQEVYKVAKTFVRCDNIREAIRNKVDFDELIGTLALEARGGYKKVNGNGVVYNTMPNLDALKLLLEYGYGKPEQSQLIEDTDKKEMLELTGLLHQIVMPSKMSVSPNGTLNENTYTDANNSANSAQSVEQSNDKTDKTERLSEVTRN